MIRTAAVLSALLASVALAACGSDSSSSNIIPTKEVSAEIPASGCGSVPTPAPEDKDGALKALGEQYQASYAGYQTPISKSVWADYKPNHPPPYKVGISWGPLVTDVQIKNYNMLQKMLKAEGIEVSATTTEGVNIPQQLGQVQTLLRAKPDILVVQGNTDAFGPLANKAGKQGIPMISISNTTTGSDYVVNMEPNNYLNGAMAASTVLRQIGGKGDVLLVHGFASTGVDQDRFKAYRAAIRACPGVKVAGEIAGAFIPATAKSETLKFLATHPGKVDAVLQTSGMAPGVMSGFEEAGRPMPAIGDVGAMNGSLGYWNDNKDDFHGYGLGFSQEDFARSQTALIKGMLDGRGLKISDIASPYEPISTKNLGEWAKEGNDLRTPGIADGPGGTFMGTEFIDGLFERKAAN